VIISLRLLDLLLKDYFGIIEYLLKKGKGSAQNDRIIIGSQMFYAYLDRNLYIKRNEKLKIYKALNLIICNSNSYASVLYDKETKKTKRMIIVNLKAYKFLKALYETNTKTNEVL